ncbi:ABC transporter ATP-binding protein [Paludibacterium paludis]|uniref:ATP-binding cassette subfamily B protein n=1 Tax=Paludibacterium paludis TaxID=1225769 RepID=A0A918UAF4_9NEIS|nr:ABC transporter ATP-binding protein [Paludibacterium paludis]GGY18466.1 hypothetical protein GCM10011289_22460 [Paludibacterium paludis]
MMTWFHALLRDSGALAGFRRYLWLTWLDIALMAVPPLAAAEFLRYAIAGHPLPEAAWWCLGAALLAPVSRLAVQWRARMLGAQTVFRAFGLYRQQLAATLLASPLWKTRAWADSALIERLGTDVRLVQEGVFIVLVRLQVSVLLSLALLLYLAWRSPLFAAAFVAGLLVCALCARFGIAALDNRASGLSRAADEVQRALSATLDGIRTLRLFRALPHRGLGLDAALDAQHRAVAGCVPRFALRDQCASALLDAALAGVLILAWTRRPDAALLPALLLAPLVYHHLFCAWQEWSLLRWSRQALERVEPVSRLPAQCGGGEFDMPGERTDLVLEDVGFGYGGATVLDGIRARFAPGSHTVIVGRNGAGKSTLLALIARLSDPDRGRVRLGDIDSRQIALGAWRARVSVILQDMPLLPGTLRDNLLLGKPDAGEAALHEALLAARCDFVADWPQGLDTLLGEGGVMLSGGERQRVAIARALLKDSEIVLLDEITSGLDSLNAALVQQAIAALSGSRTVIQITHALQQAVSADQVLVLDGGRLVESGKHASLLAAAGVYARLWANHEHSLRWQVV